MSRNDDNMSMPMPMPMPMPPPGGGTGGGGGEMATMHTSFFWGEDVVILFDGWPGTGRVGMYVLALVVVFLLAALAEILLAVPKLRTNPVAGAVVHAGVHAFRMGLAYVVMLAVMSYNIGFFMAAVAGHAVGSLLVKYRELSARKKGGEYIP